MSLAYTDDTDRDEGGYDSETEGRILRMLKAEENEALGYRQTDLQQQQITALKEYFGELYGDEKTGRSQVISREVMESIERIRPDLLRVFAGGGNVVYLEETSEQDSEYAKACADYLNWVFMVDNPGFRLLNDFAFDGLLHRRGFMAAYWREAEYRAPQTLTGLSIPQVQQLMADPTIQIIGQDTDDADTIGISLQIRRVKTPARIEIVTVAPEDMRLNGRAVEIDGGRYVGRVWRKLRGELAAAFPKKAYEISQYSGEAVVGAQATLRGSEVRTERFQDSRDWSPGNDNSAAVEVEVLEEYLRCDINEDGYPELLRCYRMGDLLLECEEVEENPFGSWTPIPVPHRFYGLSIQDITSDLQRIATVLKRAALDATYQSVIPREAFNRNAGISRDDMLSTVPGTKIGVDGPPGDNIMQLGVDVACAQSAWEALDRNAVALEERTGTTRSAQGVDPDALLTGAHSGKAIDLLQTAAAARKEMMARNMGDGLSQFFSKLHRLACRHQNQPKQMKVGGKWCQFQADPDKEALRAYVHTGLGTGNRDQTVAGINLIAQFQQTVVEHLGAQNPMVTPQHIHRTFEEMVRALGYRSADGFMAEPPDVPVTGPDGQPQVDPQTGQPAMKPWAPDPQPDPAMAKVQADQQAQAAKQQLDQAQAQSDAQLKQQEIGANLQLADQQAKAKLAQDAAAAAQALQLAREKAAAEMDLARQKADAELQLAWAQFNAETQLAQQKLDAEIELEREKLAAQREMHSEKVDASVGMHSEKIAADTEIKKNRPGGALDE